MTKPMALLWTFAVLSTAQALALLWHIGNIWRYGEHLIREPTQGILIAETVGLGVIALLGLLVMYWILITVGRKRR